MLRYFTGGLACGLFCIAAFADPPPARPDFIASLPVHQWVFAKLVWQGREPCTKVLCQAGYYSPPLLVSVNFSKNSNDEKQSIEAVVGIQGCESIGWNLMWEADYGKPDAEARYQYVADRVQSLVESMGRQCGVKDIPQVPTDQLRRLVTTPVE